MTVGLAPEHRKPIAGSRISQPDPPAGRRIGRYRIAGRLGRGRWCTVLLAEPGPPDRPGQRSVTTHGATRQVPVEQDPAGQVAIKTVRPGGDADEARRRLATEREALARLDHPGIVRLLSSGTDEAGRPYLVLGYVDGLPIDLHCDSRGLSVRHRLGLFIALCEAVQHAHRRGVLHRDITPSNVLVSGSGRPKLIDLGIAGCLAPAPGGRLVARAGSTERLMTPRYASPEQLRGLDLTPASDVYSLGVVLYELLTGRHPLAVGSRRARHGRPGDTAGIEAVEQAVLRGRCRRPSRVVAAQRSEPAGAALRAELRGTDPAGLRRTLAGDLDAIVLTCLHRSLEWRYPSPIRLAEDLARVLAGRPARARWRWPTPRTPRIPVTPGLLPRIASF